MTKIITIKQMALGLLLICFASVTFAQRKQLHVGDLCFQTDAGMLDDGIHFPQGWGQARSIYEGMGDDQLEMLRSHGVKIATKRPWTDNTGSPWDYQIAEVNGGRFTDEGMVLVPVSGAFKRTFRNPFPTKTLDGVDRTDILAAEDDDLPTIPADVMIYNKLDGWPNYGMALRIERWAYAFANTEYDDFVILEYLLTNTHATELRDSVYLALSSQLNAHSFYSDADQWGNYYGVDYWKHPNAGGTDAAADSMRVYYSWDAHDQADNPADSKGRLDPLWGTIREPQYMAYVVIHADASATDPTDDPRQPVKAGWASRNFAPNLLEYTHTEMWEFFSQGWAMDNAGLGTYPEKYSYAFDENYNQVSGGMYRALYSDKNNSGDGVDVRDYDKQTEEDKQSIFSFGPYQLEPGQDVRVVVAFAGGTIDLKTAIDAGRAYDNGYPDQYVIVPLPNDITDLEGNVIGAAGTTLTKDQKDQILDLGKDHAFNNAAKAISVWKNGSVEAGAGDFSIDLAPATPSLIGTSENDQVRLKWGGEAASDVGTGTIDGYRIYRNYYRPPAMESPTDTTFVQIDQVAATAREYVDLTVARGQDYYYYLVAVTDGEVESSWFMNLTGTTSKREDEALSPTRPFDPNWQDSVVVVPNPYHARGAYKYSGRRLVFLNLPEFANIHIYTVTGDRVQTLEHVKGVGDKDWELQDTFSTMEIVSGVYLYVVEELDKAGGEPTGEKAIGKFVVIK